MFETIVKGGWVMVPLLICSVVAVTVCVERLWFLKKGLQEEKGAKILGMVAGGQKAEAISLAKEEESALLQVLLAGMTERSNPAKAMEAAGSKEISRMKRGLPALDTIITLSPLLGLLGTIIGMINSFQVMASAGMGQPHAVTGGVAEALIATASGITVAVITLIPYNYFLARIERRTETIEQYATGLEVAISKSHRSEKYEDNKKFA